MKFAIALAFTAYQAYGQDAMSLDEKFLRYMATNGKTYATAEEFEKRKDLFAQADILI